MSQIDHPLVFEINEQLDTLNSLEFVRETLPKVINDKRYWKWVIIGLHNALQGFMVLALRGSASVNVWRKDKRRAWYRSFNNNIPFLAVGFLDKFMNLYKAIKSIRMKMFTNSQVFEPSGTQSESVRKLNELRNDFIHFTPKTWVINIHVLPGLVIDVMSIIEFLALESNNIHWNEEQDHNKTVSLITQIQEENEKIQAQYEQWAQRT